MQRQSGFTLIELIVVIVILGILAAFAVPRFVGMQEEARTSTVEGLKGSVHGAASLAHGKAMVNNTAPPPKSSVDHTGTYSINIQGKAVDFQGESTWPAGTMNGIGAMIQDTSGFDHYSTGSGTKCTVNGTGGLQTVTSPPTSSIQNCITFYPEDATNPQSCYVAYGLNGTTAGPTGPTTLHPFYSNSTADCS